MHSGLVMQNEMQVYDIELLQEMSFNAFRYRSQILTAVIKIIIIVSNAWPDGLIDV